MNSPNRNGRSNTTGILFGLLILTLLQFGLAQKITLSLNHLGYAFSGLKSSSQYYDHFENIKDFPYELEGKSFCAERDGLQFQFKFGKVEVRSWIWSNGNKTLYFSQTPTLITSYLQKGMQLWWNLDLMGKNYSFSAMPFIYPEGGSFLRAHSEIMWEGPC